MKKILILFSFLLMTACGSKSGDSSGPNPGGGDNNPTESSLKISLDTNKLFFGLVELNQNSANLTVNIEVDEVSGNKSGITIEKISGNLDDFAVASTTCSSKLSQGDECSVSLRFKPSADGLRTLSVKFKTNTEEHTVELEGIGGVFETKISDLRINLFDGQNADGSWQDTIDFDFFGTMFISKTLIELKNKIGLPGLFTSSEEGILDLAKYYLSEIEDGSGGFVLIDFDLDKDEQVQRWDFPQSSGPDGLYVKEVPFSLFDTLNVLNQEDGFSGYTYLSYYDNHLDSRRLKGNQTHIGAQYAYMISAGSERYGNSNYHRILSDISFMFESLVSQNKTGELEDLSRLVYDHYFYSPNEMRTDPTINFNLSYNIEPFVFGNSMDYVEVDQDYAILDKMLDNSGDCQIHGYAILLLEKAYANGNFTDLEKEDIYIEIQDQWEYFEVDHGPDFLGGACIPIRARVAVNLPAGLKDNAELAVVYGDLITEIEDGDEINDLAPFRIGETLKALEEILFY